MASQNYKRVNRKRLCRICGKPDWCSFTPDEKTSFCARVVEGADRVSRTGWGVFYHEKSLFPVEPFAFPRRPPPKKAELAPLEIRDFAYRKLIELAPAINSKEIIDGPKGLRARKILDFENYGALPQTQTERREIAKQIRQFINSKFPDFVRRQKSSVVGLPGFWLDDGGKIQLWSEKDYACPMMLIPYRDPEGLIQACQIRFMNSAKATENAPRYVWLSTPEKSDGIGCGSPIHFTNRKGVSSDKPILITEGALKAETAQVFKPDFFVIASGGITCSHDEIISAARFRQVFIGFDGDYIENHYVGRAFAKLMSARYNDAKKYKYNPAINILTWERGVKGIDDALLRSLPISSISPSEWLDKLSRDSRSEARQFMSEIGDYLPYRLD